MFPLQLPNEPFGLCLDLLLFTTAHDQIGLRASKSHGRTAIQLRQSLAYSVQQFEICNEKFKFSIVLPFLAPWLRSKIYI